MKVLACLLLLAGCRPTSTWRAAPPSPSSTWRTLRAEHQVDVEVATPSAVSHHHMRGLIAIQKPDRFRLRVFGPGGISLFDLLSLPSGVEILSSIRDATDPQLRALFTSIAEDLRVAYDLGSSAAQVTAVEGDHVVRTNSDRSVTLSGFVATNGAVTFTDMKIENLRLHYRVHVKVSHLSLNPVLDSLLFDK